MSGVRIAGALLYGDEAVTGIVPQTSIKAWELPQGASLPLIVVTRVSRVKVQFLAARSVWLVTERVQVTVYAADGGDRETILRLSERACADRYGTIAGFSNVAVLSDGAGSDFMDEAASIFMGSIDFRVSFNEPA